MKLWKLSSNLLALAASLLTLGGMPAALAQSQQAGNAVAILDGRFSSLLGLPDPDPASGGDLKLACLNVIYREWASAYLNVLAKTPLNPTEVGKPLTDFGRLWFNSDRNLQIFDFFRKNMSSEVTKALGILRAPGHSSTVIPELNATSMTLADVSEATYVTNLTLCLGDEFVALAMPNIGDIDPTATVPDTLTHLHQGTVTWTTATAGGIQPGLTGENASLLAFHANFGFSTKPLTYVDFLSRLQSGQAL